MPPKIYYQNQNIIFDNNIIQEEFFFVKIFKKFSTKIYIMKIAERLKELRQEHNLSQSALAKEIGVSQKAIDYWERGVNEPKATYIIKMADFLIFQRTTFLEEKTKNEQRFCCSFIIYIINRYKKTRLNV